MELPQAGRWGIPAGKVEPGEDEKDAAVREVREETGFIIPPAKIEFLRRMEFEYPGRTLEFFAYRVNLDSKFEITLDPREHQAYAWVTTSECSARRDLIAGVHRLLKEAGDTRPS